jgi:Tol biopolymer transport system component
MIIAVVIVATLIDAASAAYPGRNGTIIFGCLFSAKKFGLCSMQPNGRGLHVQEGFVAFPVWSPDGRRIVYSTSKDGRHWDQLNVINEDGTGDHPILKNFPADSLGGHHPSWSPDGKRIALMAGRGNTPEIYVLTLASHQVRKLTHSPSFSGEPDWSPDGSQIAFSSNRNRIGTDICVMSSDGSHVTCLTHANRYTNAAPDWSPDGKRIVFWSDRPAKNRRCSFGGTSSRPCEDIYIINADGTGERRLTHDPVSATGPVWSPDGSKILFVSKRGGNFQLYTMHPDGSHQTQITHRRGLFAAQPNWQPLPR